MNAIQGGRDNRRQDPCPHVPAPERIDTVRPERSFQACTYAGSTPGAERCIAIISSSGFWGRGSGHDAGKQQPRTESAVGEKGVHPETAGHRDLL